jgi:hypothetical protein
MMVRCGSCGGAAIVRDAMDSCGCGGVTADGRTVYPWRLLEYARDFIEERGRNENDDGR